MPRFKLPCANLLSFPCQNCRLAPAKSTGDLRPELRQKNRTSLSDLKLRLTWLAQLSCQRAKGPAALSGSPFWGTWVLRAPLFGVPKLGVPTTTTLKSSCLAERFPILQVSLTYVKRFSEIFSRQRRIFVRLLLRQP